MKLLINFLLAVCLFACSTPEVKTTRGRDPWLFRVNLDNRPRMIVLALDSELWAAYDPVNASLYKVWKGGIRFNGPMYDDRHNVQPSTIGVAYSVDTSRSSPWKLIADGKETMVNAEYLGYSLADGKATIRYRIVQPSGKEIRINETPEFKKNEKGDPGFLRVFETTNVPAGATVRYNDKAINSNGKTTVSAYFAPVELSLQNASASAVSQNASETDVQTDFPGKKLIDLNDCAACHTLDKKAIGPSFSMIAEKYKQNEETVSRLADKIIKGGTGVWGRQEMTPHPSVSRENAALMVTYILSAGTGNTQKQEPGLVADFYKSSIQLSQVPDLIPGQLPNKSTVVEDIEFIGTDMSINKITNDFLGFEDQFVMNLSGFITPPRPGKYTFRLKANAGARLMLNDKKVAEVNYTNYDYQKTEVEAELHEGPNSLHIEYYEDIYSSDLSLRWKTKGESNFSSIPAAAFTHNPADIKSTAAGLKDIYEINAPGYGASLDTHHPSFDVSTVRPEWFNRRISALKFLPDGKLAVSTWDSTGSIYLLEGVLDNDEKKIKAHLYATGLYEVMGLEYVDGKLYALQKWELTELVDKNNDNIADEYNVALDDWSASANFHEWAFGLIYRDGYFYFNTGISLGHNGVLTDTGMVYSKEYQTKDRGKTLKVKKGDWTFEALVHGYKAPNGIGFGVDGEIFSTDNEGHMVPTNKMMHVPQKGYPFFGNNEVLRAFSMPAPPFKPPVVWMPTGEVSNSPSQPVALKMGPYTDGQMVVGDIHHGGLNRMFIEKVAGEYQGAIFPFTQGLESGINRLSYGPDGNLYMAGLGAGGDFGHKGKCCGLQRLSYNGKPTLDMLAVRAKSNGMEIEFTESLRAGEGIYITDYTIQQFWYETGEDVAEGGVKNDIKNLDVRSVNISADRKKVFLEIGGMAKEQVVYIKINKPFLSESGHRLWTGQAWYTLNNIPSTAGVPGEKRLPRDNTLIPELQQTGWSLLFDGRTLHNWKNENNGMWLVKNNSITGSGKNVMLRSEKKYKSFEMEFDWKAGHGADAGVKTGTGKEMQLADDANNAESAASNLYLAGAVSGLIAPKYKLAKPGVFNHSRIVVDNGNTEYWLNGILVATYKEDSTQSEIVFVVQKGEIEIKNLIIKPIL